MAETSTNLEGLPRPWGDYELLAKVAEGGMGIVYKAEDSNLRRFVALKFLPEELSQDRHALERLKREAEAASALNHPNICTLYDVGPNYLVMEYIEGDSPKGPLPLDTVLDYARQMADALDADTQRESLRASEVESIARDLNVKPEEVREMEMRLSGGDVALDPGPNDDGEEAYSPIAYLADAHHEPTAVDPQQRTGRSGAADRFVDDGTHGGMSGTARHELVVVVDASSSGGADRDEATGDPQCCPVGDRRGHDDQRAAQVGSHLSEQPSTTEYHDAAERAEQRADRGRQRFAGERGLGHLERAALD